MKTQQYDAAFSMFDSTLKDVVPVDKLKAVWSGQLAALGNLTSWSMIQREEAQGRDIRIALLQFEHGQLQATIAVNPVSHDVSGFVIRPYVQPGPPAAYVDPSKFGAVETTIGADSIPLGATLTLPIGTGPFPGAVLVHGSGPNDRDETIGSNKVFKDLAEGLASRGIAVLRYDKRTFRYGAKLGTDISVDDEVVLDAVAAVKVLASGSGVDPRRIFVVGHSMGALLAPEVAVRSGAVAGIVLLAPPGRAPWDLVLSQLRYLGAPKEQIENAEQKAARLKAGNLGDERLLGASSAYWNDLAARDGIAMAKKLGRPVLILRGDRDYQILDEDVQAWRAGLAGTPHVEIETLPSLNHLFIPGSGKSSPDEYRVPGHVDAQVIEKLASFITRPPAGAR
jgi:dienelactone hydrolase